MANKIDDEKEHLKRQLAWVIDKIYNKDCPCLEAWEHCKLPFSKKAIDKKCPKCWLKVAREKTKMQDN